MEREEGRETCWGAGTEWWEAKKRRGHETKIGTSNKKVLE